MWKATVDVFVSHMQVWKGVCVTFQVWRDILQVCVSLTGVENFEMCVKVTCAGA